MKSTRVERDGVAGKRGEWTSSVSNDEHPERRRQSRCLVASRYEYGRTKLHLTVQRDGGTSDGAESIDGGIDEHLHGMKTEKGRP